MKWWIDLALLLVSSCFLMVLMGVAVKFWCALFMFGWNLL